MYLFFSYYYRSVENKHKIWIIKIGYIRTIRVQYIFNNTDFLQQQKTPYKNESIVIYMHLYAVKLMLP